MAPMTSGMILAVIAFILGVAGLTRSPRSAALFLFARLSLMLGVFFTAQVFAYLIWWQRIFIFSGALLSPHIIWFFDRFPEPGLKPSFLKSRLTVAWTLGLTTLAFLPTSYLVNPVFLGKPLPDLLVLASLIVALGLGCRSLATKLQTSHNLVYRFRVKVLLVASVMALILFLAEILFAIPPTGGIALSVLFYLFFQTLLHHRLLDLKEVLGRGVLMSLLTLMFTVFLWTLKSFDGGASGNFLNDLLFVGVIVVLFDPLKRSFLALGRQTLFARHADFLHNVQALREGLPTKTSKTEVFTHLANVLCRSGRVIGLAIYTADTERKFLQLALQHGTHFEIPQVISEKNFYLWAKEQSQPVVLENQTLLTLTNRATRLEPLKKSGPQVNLAQIKRVCDQINAQAFFPLTTHQLDFMGLMAITLANSEDDLSLTEIRILKTLAHQAANMIFYFDSTARQIEKDRLAGLGEMAAGLAHEIRNPLGAIRGAAQVLQQSAQPHPYAHFFSMILEESDRLNRVLEQFLTYARTDSAPFTDTQVNTLLEKTVDLLKAQGLPPAINLNLNLAADLPILRIQQDRLKQVFLNLLQNAVQAMPLGGSLSITTHLLAPQDPGNRLGTEAIEVIVEDTGCGMDDKSIERIFQPFFTTKEKGLGLGLAICQRIIRDHGGDLWAKSKGINQGALFGIRLWRGPRGEE